MFTGLICDVGRVRTVQKTGDWRYVIETHLPERDYIGGASVACNGCCLTVVGCGAGWFAVEVSAESLSKTTLGQWETGLRLNLEPALRVGDSLGGHIVSGHVDGVAHILKIRPDGESHRLEIVVPEDLKAFIAPKGSVTLDGISLTVNGVHDAVFDVNIIPHTWAHTTLCDRQAGETLNLEIDMLARYMARLVEVRRGTV